MNKTISTLLVAGMLAAPAAWADHNSPFGTGWATDAMGKHAEAVERVDSDMMADAPVDRTDKWGVDVDRVIDLRESAGDRRADVEEMRADALNQVRESVSAMRDNGAGRSAR
ncbi:MAG: hypothetical protein MZV65_29400 [Chromatiales bacterium]|nr:hypothetical protein [Chromatiales bacterium]